MFFYLDDFLAIYALNSLTDNKVTMVIGFFAGVGALWICFYSLGTQIFGKKFNATATYVADSFNFIDNIWVNCIFSLQR